MEYDEQVSARLDMSLDEIIGQEQQDGSGQMKKRKAKSGFTGSTAVPPPTTLPSPYRPPPALQSEYVGRPAAPYTPAPGGIGSFSSRPGPPARPLPALMGPAAGRLPAAPPFAMGPRPPFPVPLGHPRMDARWPRPRHPGGGFLVPPNGVQPPPPPVGDPSGGPPRAFPLPPRPSGTGELEYTQMRPVVGPYVDSRASGPSRPVWRRSRYADEVEGQNGHHSPHNPMAYSVGLPAYGPSRSPHLLDESSGPVPKQMPYGYGSRCPSTEYYGSAYRRDPALERGYANSASPEELVSPSVRRGPSGDPESVWNTQPTPDQCVSARGLRNFPARDADLPSGARAGACLAEGREFTVIVSNVPKDLPAVEIQEAFSCMGTVLRTDIMLNSKGEHTGRVCIAFASAEAAKTAVAQFDKGDLNGNTIRVFAE
ncbi:RNA binding motif-containing protein, putative [Eimeria necatrix]|uniref:RNA binding motif-containing protein, putative n=1 Tax=Eimeria necatrix TaxID=51315 RepID=U6MQ88_9EIME|nr:RNA binding motif-containing protein, putative [Eimeria necatrix]CDJ64624.1 RNA binding motif-containing protein, putative [Eimeria necatrix]